MLPDFPGLAALCTFLRAAETVHPDSRDYERSVGDYAVRLGFAARSGHGAAKKFKVTRFGLEILANDSPPGSSS